LANGTYCLIRRFGRGEPARRTAMIDFYQSPRRPLDLRIGSQQSKSNIRTPVFAKSNNLFSDQIIAINQSLPNTSQASAYRQYGNAAFFLLRRLRADRPIPARVAPRWRVCPGRGCLPQARAAEPAISRPPGAPRPRRKPKNQNDTGPGRETRSFSAANK